MLSFFGKIERRFNPPKISKRRCQDFRKIMKVVRELRCFPRLIAQKVVRRMKTRKQQKNNDTDLAVSNSNAFCSKLNNHVLVLLRKRNTSAKMINWNRELGRGSIFGTGVKKIESRFLSALPFYWVVYDLDKRSRI